MPPDNNSIESRLSDVEEELRRLKQLLANHAPDNAMPWWKKIIGTHENDPVFKEIVELGRKIRKRRPRKAEESSKRGKSKRSRKSAT